jgi:DNA-nicking Smr family endonuclease
MGSAPNTAGEALKYLSDGHSPDLLRKLRRGHWNIEDELDLHGMNRHQAADSVDAFLQHCRAQGLRCVRIVPGKGLVLRALLGERLPARKELLAFCEAPAAQGGSGAVLVLLKASR